MRRSPVKSAARVLEIFEYFGDERRALSLKDIVARLAYPQSSTTNLLKSLTTLGYLNYDRATRTYLPTFRVARLGQWLSATIEEPILELRKLTFHHAERAESAAAR